MAELEVGGMIAGMKGFMSAITFWIMLLIPLVIIGLSIAYFVYVSSFKHRYRVRSLTQDRKLIIDRKARKSVDKYGIERWELYRGLFKKSEPVPTPPSDAIELTPGGKMIVEAYYSEFIGYQYIRDKGLGDLEENKIKGGFQPLLTNQKILYVHELERAEKAKKADWKQHIPLFASLSVIIIILVMLFSFWGHIVEPFNEAAKIQQGTQAEITKSLQILNQMQDGNKYIPPQPINPNNPPPD